MAQSIWADEDTVRFLRLRAKTFYNHDYFEKILLPLLDIPINGSVLDVGCGFGGLTFLLARSRPDLHITGVDMETSVLDGATHFASAEGLLNVKFEPGDCHQLQYQAQAFDAVVCQTVLTHVRDAATVVSEMARVLRPGGVFMAAEYTTSGASASYDNVQSPQRDESWHQMYYRLSRLLMRGKKALGRGDDQLGNRIPALAASAGLAVFDVRINDNVLHVIPPYLSKKQNDYLELLKTYFAPDPEGNGLKQSVEMMQAAGGTVDDATWLYNAVDSASFRRSIDERTLSLVSSFLLYLIFARKPQSSEGS